MQNLAPYRSTELHTTSATTTVTSLAVATAAAVSKDSGSWFLALTFRTLSWFRGHRASILFSRNILLFLADRGR